MLMSLSHPETIRIGYRLTSLGGQLLLEACRQLVG